MKNKIMNADKKGFTLIELMVIISIVGFIVSAGILAFTTAKEKARMAKGLQFSQNIHNALGSESVGAWSFDDGGGTTALDSSGYGNNSVVNGPVWKCASDDANNTITGTGCSLQFDGLDDYVEGSANSVGASFTLSLWYERLGATNTYVPLLEQGGASSFRLLLYNGRPRFGWNNNTDDLYGTNNQYNTIGKWYHLAATYDGRPHLYINGQELTPLIQNTGSYGPWGTNKMRIGYRPYTASVGPFNGLIDDVRVYRQAFSSAQIKKIYADGFTKYQIVKNK